MPRRGPELARCQMKVAFTLSDSGALTTMPVPNSCLMGRVLTAKPGIRKNCWPMRILMLVWGMVQLKKAMRVTRLAARVPSAPPLLMAKGPTPVAGPPQVWKPRMKSTMAYRSGEAVMTALRISRCSTRLCLLW